MGNQTSTNCISDHLQNEYNSKSRQVLLALYHEYVAISSEALRVLLAARGVHAELDRRTHEELVSLAVSTHFAVGDVLAILEAVHSLRRDATGAFMVDAPL